jgi:hypothetical protein
MAGVCLYDYPEALPSRKLQRFARGQRQVNFELRAAAVDDSGNDDISPLNSADCPGHDIARTQSARALGG